MNYNSIITPELVEKVRHFFHCLDSDTAVLYSPLERLRVERVHYKRGLELCAELKAKGVDLDDAD